MPDGKTADCGSAAAGGVARSGGGSAAAGGVVSLAETLAVGWSGRGQEAEEPPGGAGPAAASGGAVGGSWLGRWERLGGVVSELD